MEKVTQLAFVERVLMFSPPDYCIVKFDSLIVCAYSALQSPFFCKVSNSKARKKILESIIHSSSVGIVDSVCDVLPP